MNCEGVAGVNDPGYAHIVLRYSDFLGVVQRAVIADC